MFTAIDSGAAFGQEIARLEPQYADVIGEIARLVDRAQSAAEAELPVPLVGLRRVATLRNWQERLPAWNRRATDRIAFLRRLGNEPGLVRLAQRLLAADFGEAVLAAGLDASEAVFPGDLLLVRSELGGALRLDGAQVLARFDAAHGRFGHEMTAEQAQFVGPVSLAHATVARSARFGFSKFMSAVDLDGASFGKEVWLRHAEVAGDFTMRAAHLSRDAGLGACTYGGDALFTGTRFDDTVSFEDAVFRETLTIDGCVFAARLRLAGVALGGGLSAANTRFGGEVIPPIDTLAKPAASARTLLAELQKKLGER